MKKLPIRIRLTVWYFVVFACAGAVLCVVSWLLLERSLKSVALYEMGERIDDVQTILNTQPPNVSLDSLKEQFYGYTSRDDGKWLQILDEDGNWIFRSERMKAAQPVLPIPREIGHRDVVTKFQYSTRRYQERPGLALLRVISVHGRLYSVQTGLSQSTSFTLLQTFARDLLLLTPALLFLAAILGYWMSRKALTPIAELALRARQISGQDLNIRLPVPDTNDEISHLSITLNQMLTRIESGVRSIREFTASAAHELRTPLSLIRTEVEVILSFPRSEKEYRESYKNIQQDTVRMTGLIDNLLLLARTDAGAEMLRFENIDMAQTVRQIGEKWNISMQRALLDFHIETGNTPIQIIGDHSSIMRLINILLENASQYTAPGGSVKLRATAKDRLVLIEVQDSGIGIAAEHLPHIFERFYRVDETRNYHTNGSGLGLALAKWIADQHHATLAVESKIGIGTLFRLTVKQELSSEIYQQKDLVAAEREIQ